MTNDEGRLPTQLWLMAGLRRVASGGGAYYILRRGEPNSGVVCVKWRRRAGNTVRLYIQERGANGALGWRVLTPKDSHGIEVEEAWSDGYIARAAARDPDLWAVEIETDGAEFPFEGHVF